MSETPLYDVFLSHNSAQKDWVRRLVGGLRDSGKTVFFDEDSIALGEDVNSKIESALRSSRRVILVLSPEALASKWVALELSMSLYRDPSAADRVIIPILRIDCEIPLTLARLKWLDARDEKAFQEQIAQLLSALSAESALAILTADAPRWHGSSVSSHVKGARPKQPNILWRLLYVLALLLLVFLGLFIYFTIQRGQETPLDIAKPSPTELTGIKKAASSSPSGAGEPKPASSSTGVKPFNPPPPQPAREWTNSIAIKLVRIEAGEFLMGTTKDQVDQLMRIVPGSMREWFGNEQPAHSVRLSKAFYFGVHEVTQGQYQAVKGDNPSQFKGSDDLPVENVSWLDAVSFCNKLSEVEKRTPFYRIDGTEVTLAGGNGYRLPTEAEWEYACRAKSTTLYPFGDDASKLGEHEWYRSNSEAKTHPVGQKLPNAWGLHDMLGNVSEWCADGYDEKYYASSPPSDPPGAPERRTGSSAAVPGAATRGSAGRPSAVGAGRGSGTKSSGSAWPRSRNDLGG